MRLFVLEDLICIWRGGVEDESVWKNNRHRVNRMIGIFKHTTTHAARVIGEDAAQHACVNGTRVGPDTALMRLEYIIDKPADYARLKADQIAILFHTVISPMLGNIHENPIRDSLT